MPPSSRGACGGILHSRWGRWETQKRQHRTRSMSMGCGAQRAWLHQQRWRLQQMRRWSLAARWEPWRPDGGKETVIFRRKLCFGGTSCYYEFNCTLYYLLYHLFGITTNAYELWINVCLRPDLSDEGLSNSLVLKTRVGEFIIVVVRWRAISMVTRAAHGCWHKPK